MRIVFDTNVLVSAFAARGLCADLFRDVLSHHTLMVSEGIVEELHKTLTKRLKVPEETARSIRALLIPYMVKVGRLPKLQVSLRDKDDIKIVAFAMAVNADLLITGDRDLHDVADELPVKVIPPREFYPG